MSETTSRVFLSFDPLQAAQEDAEAPDLPIIQVEGGKRHTMAEEALRAMHAHGVEFYQRDRSLVRVACAKAKTSDGQVIEVPGVVRVTIPIMGRAMGQSATWQRETLVGKRVVIHPMDPPKDVVEQVAAMVGEWPFPPISGVISTPTMRPDGTILDQVGYDKATGLVLMAPPKMPPMPDYPTRYEAELALEVLQSLLKEFPFVDDASRAVALSMILTVVLRGALAPAVPMHAATAPAPGTGKSFLSDIVSAIATGERCAVIASSPNVEETEKRLIGAALSGQQIIAIDNVSEMLTGDFLNQVTERPLLQIRPLGTSVTIRIPNTFTVFANGNNLSAPADLVRRTLICRLDANVENPETREFDRNPVTDVLRDRGRYIAAALTIGRAYVLAGYPDQLPSLPSFERWSDLVRSALAWLGCGDACASMDMARAEDPIREEREAVFVSWPILPDEDGNPKSEFYTVARLTELAEETLGMKFVRADFRAACLEIASDKEGQISSKRLGRWLARNRNLRIGNLKLIAKMPGNGAKAAWSVKQA